MGLLELSDEILDQIAEHLVPGLDESLGVYESAFEGPSFTDGRLALLALTKTNRRLNTIATRHLYHTICLCDLRALVEVLSTCVQHPHLAEHVRILAVVASLLDNLDDIADSLSEELFAGITVESKAYGFLERCFGEFDQPGDLTWSNWDDYVESCCALLFCLTGNVHTLYIHCPNWNVAAYDALMALFESTHQEGEGILPHLTRLCLTADPGVSDPLLPHETPHPYMAGMGVRRLELFGANMLCRDDYEWAPERWRKVEVIHTGYAYSTGDWWYRLCNEARPPLKDIEIYVSPYWGDGGDQDEPGYNEALLLCTNTLERLIVDFGSAGPSHLGPEKRLSCLAYMANLKSLDLSVTLLFESASAMQERSILDVLPPGLEELNLNEDYTHDPWDEVEDIEPDEMKTLFPALLRRALTQLVFEGGDKLPRLNQVQLSVSADYWDGAGEELEAVGESTNKYSTVRMSFAPLEVRKVRS